MSKIVIIGGGGHAKSLINTLKKIEGYQIIGYIALNDGGDILGIPYLGDDTVLDEVQQKYKCRDAIIGVGNVNVSDKRRQITDELKSKGFIFPTVISPTAMIGEDVTIGQGTVVLDGVIVNVGTQIGKYCIINTGSIIDHDCQIGNFVHLAPGAVLSGGVNIGDHTMIGAGASVIQGKTVGSNCMIGAAASVTDDCLETGTYVGIPARK